MNRGTAAVRAELDRLVTLIEVSRSLTAELDLPDIIQRILEGAIQVIPAAEAGILFLYDHERRLLVVNHAVGFGPRVYDLMVKPGEGLSGHAFSHRRASVYTNRSAVVTAMKGAETSNLMIFSEASGGTDYPQSAISAPLIYKGEALGAMVVENLYRPAVFQPFDLQLLDALAQAAAIAIVNARLYAAEHESRLRLETLNHEIRLQRDQLERRLHVQDSLAGIVRDDLPLSALATRLAAIVRGSVVIADSLYRVRASDTATAAESVRELGLVAWDRLQATLGLAARTRGQQHLRTAAGGLLVCPVSAGPETLGFVLVEAPGRELDGVDQAATDSAALIAAAQLLRERAVQEGEISRRGHLLDRLLAGELPDALAWLPQAQPPFRLVVGMVHPVGERLQEAAVRVLRAFLAVTQEALDGQHRPLMVTLRGDNVVAIQARTGAPVGDDDQTLRALEGAAARLERLAPEWRAAYAVEDDVPAVSELASAYEETRLAIALRERLGSQDRVFAVRSLGAYRLIMRAASGPEVVELCLRTLQPVIDHDRRTDAGLLDTFRTYLDSGSSLKAAAARLRVHPHTVDYRLGRLRELTGLDLRRAEDRLTLELAVRVLDAAVDLRLIGH
ncbi:MAG TPA: helix-turn-helix domain-containing protein [Terriglobales bacterium]|nr:helix-turn-helix domain-containing protein [Terriglobales bacterium]